MRQALISHEMKEETMYPTFGGVHRKTGVEKVDAVAISRDIELVKFPKELGRALSRKA
jgi:hypothetical protein